MSDPNNPKSTSSSQAVDPAVLRNIIGNCLLRKNFIRSTRSVYAAKKSAIYVNPETLDKKSEEYERAKIEENMKNVIINKTEYFVSSQDSKLRLDLCFRRHRFIGAQFLRVKPEKELAIEFGKLYIAFEIYTEQRKFIETAGKKLLGAEAYISVKTIAIMEDSLEAFALAFGNSFKSEEAYKNMFRFRDACIDELKQWCTTLIPMRNGRNPVLIRDNPNRYQPFDIMFLVHLQTVEKDLEALKFLCLTSANHQKISILRTKILCQQNGISTKTSLPLPDVPITCRKPNFEELRELKSQRYTNHHNEIKEFFLRLDRADKIIPEDEQFKFLYWFDALRELCAVTLGSIVKRLQALRDDQNDIAETWERNLYALSIYSRISGLLLNMQSAASMYVDKTHGLIGKRLKAEVFSTLQDALYYTDDDTFDKEQVETFINQLHSDIIQECANFLFTHEAYVSEKITQAPNLDDYQVDFRYELTTLYKNEFSPFLVAHSDAMFRQLSIEKFEILRLAGELKCLEAIFANGNHDKTELKLNLCAPYVDAFSSNVRNFLSPNEAAKLVEDAKISTLRAPDTDFLAYDLANMVLDAAGKIRLSCRATACLFFENRFRFYVGTRLPRMLNTREISKFFFAFMWSAIQLEVPDGEQEDEDDEESDEDEDESGEGSYGASSIRQLDLDDLDDDMQTLVEKCALLLAERFLSHALECGLYSHDAVKTPLESLIYRWLLNKHFQSTREHFVRYHPQKEAQFGEKGILYFGNNVTDPLTPAEQMEFMPMSVKLSNELIPTKEIDEILGVSGREKDLSCMLYVETD